MLNDVNTEIKILAYAVFEIRVLLADYLGLDPTNHRDRDPQLDFNVKKAAHLAYALHNEALAVLENKHFDVDQASARIRYLETVLADLYNEEKLPPQHGSDSLGHR